MCGLQIRMVTRKRRRQVRHYHYRQVAPATSCSISYHLVAQAACSHPRQEAPNSTRCLAVCLHRAARAACPHHSSSRRRACRRCLAQHHRQGQTGSTSCSSRVRSLSSPPISLTRLPTWCALGTTQASATTTWISPTPRHIYRLVIVDSSTMR